MDHRSLWSGCLTGEQAVHVVATIAVLDRGPHARLLEEIAEPQVVLLGKHLGRRHHRPLEPGLHPREETRDRYHGLARPDLALEKTLHRSGGREILLELADGPALRVGERERKGADEAIHQVPVRVVGDPDRSCSLPALLERESDLEPEQLIEDETLSGRRDLGDVLGKVNGMQRRVPAHETQPLEHVLGEHFVDGTGAPESVGDRSADLCRADSTGAPGESAPPSPGRGCPRPDRADPNRGS